MKPTPTAETYGALLKAYDFFNDELFEGRLPPCLMTLQRKSKRTHGFFAPKRFENSSQKNTDELAMNPIHFGSRDLTDVLSTLVHEMTHVEQEYFGKPSRRGYHNKEWGRLMKRVGLYPSNTGQPGGKETGQQMTHFVTSAGPFQAACENLVSSGFTLKWAEVDPASKQGAAIGGPLAGPKVDSSNRVKFRCPSCVAQAWGKPSLKLICGKCRLDMTAAF